VDPAAGLYDRVAGNRTLAHHAVADVFDADVEYLVEAPGIIWSELRMLKAA
jgi:hypothetical protein